MKKHILAYILSATCILKSCNTDYYEPDAGTSGRGDMLILSVSDAGFSNSDEAGTRASENYDGSTEFDDTDVVGLTILDASGNLLADNVPYRHTDQGWVFDSKEAKDKQIVYYDSSMSTYIVYYPYRAEADGIKSKEDLKSKKDSDGVYVFEVKDDQSDKDDFVASDLMAYEGTIPPKKD